MSFTAISSSRCSTPITMSAASCRSTSTTPRQAVRSPCCCAPARRPRASRSAVTYAGWSVAYGSTGRRRASPSAATAITAARRSWSGATRMASTSSFGLPGNTVLDRLVDQTADDIRTRRALDQKPSLRGFAETSYQAQTWNTARRACARIETPTKGLDIRFVVTSIETGSAEHVYQTLYCARGQAENLIKLHKAQLASDRTSCRSPLANQMRLILHTAAYWLMLTLRDAIPKAHALATAEFNTIRLRLLKLGARVVEMTSRVRLAFAAACPDATLIRHIAAALMPTGP